MKSHEIIDVFLFFFFQGKKEIPRKLIKINRTVMVIFMQVKAGLLSSFLSGF